MLVQKIDSIMERFDDPKYPLLGPNVRGLYWIGMWQGENKLRNAFFKFVYFVIILFIVSIFVDLYFERNDPMLFLSNISVTLSIIVTISKAVIFILNLQRWKNLVENISREEISALENNDPKVIKLMKSYKTYSRLITFFYTTIIFTTDIAVIILPFIKYITVSSYREMIKNGTEPLPQIFDCWLPFDKTKMPGYLLAVFLHMGISTSLGGITAFYDSAAVAIMVFLKGQLQILRYKCEQIFGDSENIPRNEVMNNIKECHRLHNFITEQHNTFNTTIAPATYIYVLLCSVMICFDIVRLSMKEVTFSQKIMVLQFTVFLTSQLFVYCWHSNEIAYESYSVDQGVYSSNWWRGDVYLRKQVLLLAGKLSPTLILDAGPFTTFSTATFINIIKASYSFYTLVTQMRDD